MKEALENSIATGGHDKSSTAAWLSLHCDSSLIIDCAGLDVLQ